LRRFQVQILLPASGWICVGGPTLYFSTPSQLVSQLISLPPVVIFDKFLFNLEYLFDYFSAPTSTAVLKLKHFLFAYLFIVYNPT